MRLILGRTNMEQIPTVSEASSIKPAMPPNAHAIAEGDSFESFSALKEAVKIWSTSVRFTHIILHSDRHRVRIGCRGDQACPFLVIAKWKENIGQALVTKVVDRHNCLGGVVLGHQITSSVSWLKKEIPKLLEVDTKITTKSIKSVLRLKHAVDVPDKQIQRARKELLAETANTMSTDFRKVPAYLKRLLEANPETESGVTVAEYQLDQEHFHRVFVCPGTGAYAMALNFMALDGTYCRNCYHLTLLTASMRDNDGGIFLIAWSVVESENSSSWRWFLSLLKKAIPTLGNPPFVIISDRDKGCRAADDVFPWATRATCAWHLQQNMLKKTKSKECALAVRWLARAIDEPSIHRQERKVLQYGGQVRIRLSRLSLLNYLYYSRSKHHHFLW